MIGNLVLIVFLHPRKQLLLLEGAVGVAEILLNVGGFRQKLHPVFVGDFRGYREVQSQPGVAVHRKLEVVVGYAGVGGGNVNGVHGGRADTKTVHAEHVDAVVVLGQEGPAFVAAAPNLAHAAAHAGQVLPAQVGNVIVAGLNTGRLHVDDALGGLLVRVAFHAGFLHKGHIVAGIGIGGRHFHLYIHVFHFQDVYLEAAVVHNGVILGLEREYFHRGRGGFHVQVHAPGNHRVVGAGHQVRGLQGFFPVAEDLLRRVAGKQRFGVGDAALHHLCQRGALELDFGNPVHVPVLRVVGGPHAQQGVVLGDVGGHAAEVQGRLLRVAGVERIEAHGRLTHGGAFFHAVNHKDIVRIHGQGGIGHGDAGLLAVHALEHGEQLAQRVSVAFRQAVQVRQVALVQCLAIGKFAHFMRLVLYIFVEGRFVQHLEEIAAGIAGLAGDGDGNAERTQAAGSNAELRPRPLGLRERHGYRVGAVIAELHLRGAGVGEVVRHGDGNALRRSGPQRHPVRRLGKAGLQGFAAHGVFYGDGQYVGAGLGLDAEGIGLYNGCFFFCRSGFRVRFFILFLFFRFGTGAQKQGECRKGRKGKTGCSHRSSLFMYCKDKILSTFSKN